MNENVDYPSIRLLSTHKICSSYDMISIYKIVVVSVVCFTNKTLNPIMLTLISLWKNPFTLLFSLSNNITQDYFLFIKIKLKQLHFHSIFNFPFIPPHVEECLKEASNFHALKHKLSNLVHLPFHHQGFSYLTPSKKILWPLGYTLSKVLPH